MASWRISSKLGTGMDGSGRKFKKLRNHVHVVQPETNGYTIGVQSVQKLNNQICKQSTTN